MFQIPEVSNPFVFLGVTLFVFAVVVGRYFLVAGVFYVYFYVWNRKKWEVRKLSRRSYPKHQFKREVAWSMLTALIFGLAGALSVWLWQAGLLKIYVGSEYPFGWVPFSLVIALVLHETYYYWLHRLMHHPAIFNIVHKVHHQSNITSPWTAFSFHPFEGILQAIFLPVLLMFLPMHLYVLVFLLTFMTITSVINHLEIEIYPKGFHRHGLGKWMIGATHHSLHHKQFRFNYGLYFTFWDKWVRTESPSYNATFEKTTNAVPETAVGSGRLPGLAEI